jgi:hypothetical protein
MGKRIDGLHFVGECDRGTHFHGHGTSKVVIECLESIIPCARRGEGLAQVELDPDGSIWLLTPPRDAVGTVPAGGTAAPLTVAKAAGSNLTLTWSVSCAAGDNDYEVYEGTLGDFASHAPISCTTAGATSATVAPSAGNRYYLVVPRNAFSEGSYGRRHDGSERPQSLVACRPQVAGACF